MHSLRPLLAALSLLAVLSTACSSSDDEPTAPDTTTTSAEGESDPASTTTLADGSTDEPAAGLDADLAAVGVATIELVTPETGGGRRPVLEWQPVDGAVEYQVALLTPSGEPYWGWITDETSVPVGGEPTLDDAAAGPSVVAGMTWSVSAYGTDFDLVGLSDQRSISP